MEKYIIWYVLQLKRVIKRKTSYLQLVIMVGLVLLLHFGTSRVSRPVTVGICNEEGSFCEEMIQALIDGSEVINYERFDDQEKMKEAVVTGEIGGGFLIKKGFQEKLETGKVKKCVVFYESGMNTAAAIFKEAFYSVFLKQYSKRLLEESIETVYGKQSEAISEVLLEANKRYIKSQDLFDINVVKVSGEKKEEQERDKTYPIGGSVALFILLVMLMSAYRQHEAKEKAIYKALTRRESVLFKGLSSIAEATLFAGVGVVLLLMLPENRGIIGESLAMLRFVLYSSAWLVVFGSCFKKASGWHAWTLTILFVNFIISPIIFDLSRYIPATAYIRYLLPLGIYF